MRRKLTIKLRSVVRPIVTDGYAVWIQKMRTDNARKLLRKHIQKKNCERNLLTNNEPSIEGIVTGQRLRWMEHIIMRLPEERLPETDLEEGDAKEFLGTGHPEQEC